MPTNSNLLKFEVDLGEIPEKLYKILSPSGWSTRLRGFMHGEEFRKIIGYLIKTVNENMRFTPPLNQLLSGFTFCPERALKIIMLGDGPSPLLSCSNGLLFGTHPDKNEVLLPLIGDELRRVIAPKLPVGYRPDLPHWAAQGVLLLHSSLTTQIGYANRHRELWAPFISYLLDILSADCRPLVFVFFGANAQGYAELISDRQAHLKIMMSNPYAELGRRKSWCSDGLFVRINEHLTRYSVEPISWVSEYL